MKLTSIIFACAAISVPQLAFATPTSTTSFTINNQFYGQAPKTRSDPPRVAAAGLSNVSGLEIKYSSASNFFAKSTVAADGNGASLHVGVALNSSGLPLTGGARNESDSFAKAIIGDSLTFNNVNSATQSLHLHKTINLFTSEVGGYTPIDNSERFASEITNLKGEIYGDGIDGVVSNQLNDIEDINGDSFTGGSDLPDVNFDMYFTIGDTKEFYITISAFDQIITLNDRGTPFVDYFISMNFLSGGALTDVVTGKSVCGVTATSASGFNYLDGIDVAACQVDGGGDGGNGGSGAGDVPEPASWALMLGGFGLVGGAMRASRRERTVVSL